jgi:protein-S-isoprenylcysteine O-methyltransferase Ste14
VNSFASAAVEISKEQKVISVGPYSVVRHPWYSASLIIFLFSPIALDSLLGIIPAILTLITLIFRILDEEKYLKINLQGYKDY